MPRKKKEAESSEPVPSPEPTPAAIVEIPQHYERIEISRIEVSGNNPRKEFDPEALEDLKSSIREHGILEPLIVRPIGEKDSGRYELIAGERRFRAANSLGLLAVPCVIKVLDDHQAREIMIIENLQRADLQPLEVANALQVLLEGGMTQEALAKKLGKSQGWVANSVRLLKAPEDLQKLLISREITPKHAQVLLPYAEYPLYDVLSKELKDDLQRGPVSVEHVKEIVHHHLTGDWRAENVLDFTRPPYEKQKFIRFFDRTGCEGCKHIVKVFVRADDEHEICLNLSCFRIRMENAARAFEEERNKIKESAEASTKIKGSVMDIFEYGEYERMDYAPFDQEKAGCLTCSKRKITTKKEAICLDPKCFRNKKTQNTKAINKKNKNMHQVALDAIEVYRKGRTGSLNKKELRMVLDVLAGELRNGSATRQGLEPWTKQFCGFYVTEFTSKVPDADLETAVLNLCLMRELEKNTHSDEHEKLKARVESLSKEGDSLEYVRAKEQKEVEATSPVDPQTCKICASWDAEAQLCLSDCKTEKDCLECFAEMPAEDPKEKAGEASEDVKEESAGYICPEDPVDVYGSVKAAKEGLDRANCEARSDDCCKGPKGITEDEIEELKGEADEVVEEGDQ